ncbi:MAG: hypothetical protein Fur0021_16440 [Candidatus Promineifilaceae bacterium]
MASTTRPQRWIIWLVLLLGVWLHLGMLAQDSLWLDEALSIQIATTHDRAALWQQNVDARHPSLYYVILHETLARLGSQNEAAARLPSALASALNLGLVYLLGRRLFHPPEAAWLATALLAVAPLSVWYAAEARMYALVTTAGLLLALGLAADRWWGAPLVLLALSAGLYLDYTLIPLWAGLIALWLFDARRSRRSLLRLLPPLAAMAVAWWLYRPQLPHLWQLLNQMESVYIFERLRQALGLAALSGWLFLAGLVGLAVLIFGAAAAFYQALHRPVARRWVGPLLLAAFALTTLLLALPRFYTLKRILVVGWPYIVLLVAWMASAWSQPRPRLAARLLLLSLLAAGATVLTPKDDWRGVTVYVGAEMPASDHLWIDPPWNAIPYNYYQPLRAAERGRRAGSAEELAALANEARAQGADIWLISERFGSPPPTSASEAWLDAHWQLVETIPFYRLELRRYQPLPP